MLVSSPQRPGQVAARAARVARPRASAAATQLAEEARANDSQYVVQTYSRPPVVFTHGRGCFLYDTEGKEYLDFAAGIAVNCLGHSDPGWQAALAEQAAQLCHTSNLYLTLPGGRLARGLVERSFADRVFFANSGTEANEAALKFARKYQRARWEAARGPRLPWSKPATDFVAFSDSFHGRTLGALSLTWKEAYRAPFEPLLPGARFATFGDLASARRAVRRGRTAAILVEPVQGEGGIKPAQAAFLAGLRALADESGALLIFDEVQCGLGRSGRLWAHEWSGVTPDMMTLAKPLAAGLPIGALLVTQAVADALKPGDHGSTFAGGPLVCAAAEHVLDRVSHPDFLAAVRARGDQLLHGLRSATAGLTAVREVRGSGLLVGVQLDRPAAPLVEALRGAGLLAITAGKGDVLRLAPPLVVQQTQVNQAIALIAREIGRLA